MTKKILVPVDGSEQARKAIDFAASLAKQDDAVIHLLNVYKLPIVPEGMGEYVISDRIELQALGDQIIAVAQDEARKKGVL